jgi:hypothetical protein
MLLAIAVTLAAGSLAGASPVLQMDINSFNMQARSSDEGAGPWGGIHHTGSIFFSKGDGALQALLSMDEIGGASTNLGFAGVMDAFSGRVDLQDGQVTGGQLSVHLSSGDTYATNITPGVGRVSNFVGGGFTLDAITAGGLFSDSQFANVDVSPWQGAQGNAGLPGSFLQFKFKPNSDGFSTSDMDLFVDAVPLPPAAWTGLATLGVVGVGRRLRRR